MEALMENLRYPEDEFEAGLPTMDDLPSEFIEDCQLPDDIHPPQCNLLKEPLLPIVESRGIDDWLIATELNIHYHQSEPLWHKRPDWFLAVGVSPERDKRKSYLTWKEQVRPYLVIEILSKSTEDEDLGLTVRKGNVPTKWEVYQDILKVPYYVCFDQRKSEIKAFRREKSGFVQMVIPKSGLWLKGINLGLRIWDGDYQKQAGPWLRFYDKTGKLLPTDAEETQRERAEKEHERAEKEHERSEKERERAEKERALEGEARQRIEKERALAGEARQRAEKERERAEKERLLAMLKAAGINPDKA